MKKKYFVLVCFCALAFWFGLNFQTSAQSEVTQSAETTLSFAEHCGQSISNCRKFVKRRAR